LSFLIKMVNSGIIKMKSNLIKTVVGYVISLYYWAHFRIITTHWKIELIIMLITNKSWKLKKYEISYLFFMIQFMPENESCLFRNIFSDHLFSDLTKKLCNYEILSSLRLNWMKRMKSNHFDQLAELWWDIKTSLLIWSKIFDLLEIEWTARNLSYFLL
jgi:hypothetical protein